MADMVEIEVRCKGNFAYVRGDAGERWVGVPKHKRIVQDSNAPAGDRHRHTSAGHTCQLYVLSGIITTGGSLFESPNTDVGSPLFGFRQLKQPLQRLFIKKQKFAQAKDGATSPIPSTGVPNGDIHHEKSWRSAGFIPSLRRLHPPLEEPKADKTQTAFRWTLPLHTQWYGLPPWQELMRSWVWKFKDNEGEGVEVIPPQAITDVVGFRLKVPVEATLEVNSDLITLDFSSEVDYALVLTASPDEPKKPEKDKPLKHFQNLYDLSQSFNKKKAVLPVAPENAPAPPSVRASDIFCPGGEEEGGG